MNPTNCLTGIFNTQIIQALQEAGLVDALGNAICNCEGGTTGGGDCGCTINDILGNPAGLAAGSGVFVQPDGTWGVGSAADRACCDFDMIYSAPCCLTDGAISNGQISPPEGFVSVIEVIGDSPAPLNITFDVVFCGTTSSVAGPFTIPQGSTSTSIPVGFQTFGVADSCLQIRILGGLPENSPDCWRATFQIRGDIG